MFTCHQLMPADEPILHDVVAEHMLTAQPLDLFRFLLLARIYVY